jgi:phosphoribosylanthranilate isomerase
MFHIKICGVRAEADVEAVVAAGADAIGLNFFPPSVRYLDPSAQATRDLSLLARDVGLLRVGVVVNRSVDSMVALCERLDLDAIQLHGDESPADASQLLSRLSRPILRAIKLPQVALPVEEISVRAEPWIACGCHLLLDADAGKSHGGSGKTLHWPSVRAWAQRYPDVQWTLAGGLTPDNVAEAIRRSGARSVDTASGVEHPPGVKNREKIERFCRQSGLV